MFGFGTQARADIIPICADYDSSEGDGLGAFTGTVAYGFDGDDWVLEVCLTNTTDEHYLTAFAFNVPTGASLGGYDDLGDGNFVELNAPVSTSPYGSHDAGAGIDADSWLGGGNPANGLDFGESACFMWVVSGVNLDMISAADFLDPEDDDYGFVVRFRGIGEGSDKVAAKIIPLPAPLAMGLFGLAAVAFGSRRMRKV
ncbi:MAG: hypothetical protein ACYTG1_09785 [Planctomycetota bacterium]